MDCLRIEFKNKKYNVPSVPLGCVYRIFDGGSYEVVDAIADILVLAYEGLGGKILIPSYKFNCTNLRKEILVDNKIHDNKSQTAYLRETRSYWEDRYTNKELLTMYDLYEIFWEIDTFSMKKSSIGNEWYELFYKIRGDLPKEYPYFSVSFQSLITNVMDRKFIKEKNRKLKEFFNNHPEVDGKEFDLYRFPDIVFDYDIDLDPGSYFDYYREIIVNREKALV